MDEQLLKALGFSFHDERLLRSAFIHRSFRNEHPDRVDWLPSNERLEFLGDAVLTFLTAAWLFRSFPDKSEGELSKLRSALVKTDTLAQFARELNLGSYARIVHTQDSPEARERAPLLADLFEALLAAIYLDQGIETARGFVEPFLARESVELISGQRDEDYRSRFQQVAQSRFGLTPTYQTIEEVGPAHAREFTVEVLVGAVRLGVGHGLTKQAAARDAARHALESDLLAREGA